MTKIAASGRLGLYAALAHKVWSLLVECRFDAEIRDWHALLHQVKAHIRSNDMAAAERVTALADLLRESISLSETSPAREVARRPNARRILEMLAKEDGLVPRRKLLDTLGMRSANLSNVLTVLLAHKLVERRDKGKEAEFRVTRFGRQLLESEEHPAATTAPQALAKDVDLLARLLRTDMHMPSLGTVWLDQGVHLVPLASSGVFHGPVSNGELMQDVEVHMEMPRWHGGGNHVPATTPRGSLYGGVRDTRLLPTR